MFILTIIQSLIESDTALHIETHFYCLKSLQIVKREAGTLPGVASGNLIFLNTVPFVLSNQVEHVSNLYTHHIIRCMIVSVVL